MKKYYFNVVFKMIADVLSVPVIIVLAYSLKFKIGWFFNYFFDLEFGVIYHHAQVEPYLKHIIVLSLSLVLIFLVLGVYKKFDGFMYRIEETIAVIKGLSAAIILLLLSSIIYGVFPESRGVMLNGWLIAIIIMIFTRKVIDSLTRVLFPEHDQNIVMIGSGQKIQVLLEGLLHSRQKINYVGTYCENIPTDMILFYKKKFNHLGPVTADITEQILNNQINTVYIDPDECDKETVKMLVLYCESRQISVHIIHANDFTLHGSVNVSEFLGVTMLSYPSFYFKRSIKVIKRIFDITVSLSLIIILFPILLCISIWIKVVSPSGGVIYNQTRVGIDQKEFDMFKFRTMIPNAEVSTGPIWANENEDRYIPGGKFLRQYSLDELPQLFNVLRNDMSIVGPRPERKYFVDKILNEVPHFNLRHTIKGGLTGWAQIHGRAYMTNKPSQKVAYDLYYISNWSFILDIKIIIKTFFVVLKGEQAY